MSWADSTFFYHSCLRDYRCVTFSDCKIKIPLPDMDFLIHVAHINYEPLHITLSDLIYLNALSKQLNWGAIYSHTKKYSWEHTMFRTITYINMLNEYFHAYNMPFINDYNYSNKFVFPLTLPRLHIIKSVLEKNIIKYSLKKSFKALNVLLSGDAYGGYYEPIESFLLEPNL